MGGSHLLNLLRVVRSLGVRLVRGVRLGICLGGRSLWRFRLL